MALTIGELTAYLRLQATNFNRGVQNARRQLSSLKDDVDKSARNVKAIGEAAESIGKPAGIAALAGAAVTLSANLAPAAGALLTTGAAAGVAVGAFAAGKMATAGMGDALSALADGDAAKAAEALAELSPSAASAVRAMDGVRKSYEGVQQRVQEKTFEGLGQEISAVGSAYLPILDQGLTSIAERMNLAAGAALNAARGQQTMANVSTVLAGTGPIVGNLMGMVTNLGRALLATAAAGMPFLDQFTQWAGEGLGAAAAFLETAEGAEWLRQKMTAGVVVLQQLTTLVTGVGSLLGSVFAAANVGGGSLLVTLGQLVTRAAEWAATAEGQAQLVQVFTTLRIILESLAAAVAIFGGAFLQLVAWFSTLPAPVQTVVASFLSWSLLLGALVAKFAPLIAFLARLGPLLLSGAGALVMVAARWGLLGTAAAVATTQTNASALSVLRVWALMAITSIRHALTVAGAWLLTTGAAAATAVATMAATAASYVVGWTIMAAGATWSAIKMAAAWFIALGPIGWVIAAVVALVALIVANWDKVKTWTVNAWNAVFAAVSGAVSRVIAAARNLGVQVVSFVVSMAARLVTTVVSAWVRARAAFDRGVSAAVALMRALPGRILSAVAGFGRLLVRVGGDLLRGLYNGIADTLGWLLGKVRSIGSSILSAAKSALGIASPSKEMRDEVGVWIPEGIAAGIESRNRVVRMAVIRGVTDAVAAGRDAIASADLGAPQVSGIGRAAAAILDRIRSGGHMFEDLSWRGMPDWVGKYNDQLLDMKPRGDGTREDVAAFLERFIAQQERANAQAAARQRQATAAGVSDAFSGGLALRVDGRGVARMVNKHNAEDYRLGSARTPVVTGRR